MAETTKTTMAVKAAVDDGLRQPFSSLLNSRFSVLILSEMYGLEGEGAIILSNKSGT